MLRLRKLIVHPPVIWPCLNASAFIHPGLIIALGFGVILVAILLFRSWNTVESTMDQGNTPPMDNAMHMAQATGMLTAPSRSSSPLTQSLPSLTAPSVPTSPSAPVVREEPKQQEQIFEVLEPAPTPVPVYVPAVYAKPETRAALSDEQRRLLDQAASDFNHRIQSSGLGPYSPGYAELWKQSAQYADDVFRQQYGDDALQALKGGPPAPTPEPTPLSPEDDAFRARYGDEALELRVLEREGRLIRVSQ